MEATPLTEVDSKSVKESPHTLNAAPGLAAADITPTTSGSDVETRLQRLESQMRTLVEQSQTQQQNAQRSHNALARLTHALEQARVNVTSTVPDETQQEEPVSPEAERMAEATQVALLDRQVSTEQIDPRWSKPASDQIRTAIADGGFTESTLNNVACQATLCRLEVEHRNSMVLDQFLGEFFARLGWDTNSYSQTTLHEDGSVNLVLYVSREHHDLPQPPSRRF
jgi:uncharacterized surface anchored protein